MNNYLLALITGFAIGLFACMPTEPMVIGALVAALAHDGWRLYKGKW